LESRLANGVYPIRYESFVTPGRGDRSQEYYLGLNRYFYGHKLKWMLAVEHAQMHDAAADGGAYSGWGFTSGFRVSW
jgi:phosphate-selective porin OprO/OprP